MFKLPAVLVCGVIVYPFAKVVAADWGDIPECRTNQQKGWFEESFLENIYFGRATAWACSPPGLVRCELDDHPFFQCIHSAKYHSILFIIFFKLAWCKIAAKYPSILFILFFKPSRCKIASAARNWINSVLQTAATTFAFSSVFILLQCCMQPVHHGLRRGEDLHLAHVLFHIWKKQLKSHLTEKARLFIYCDKKCQRGLF